MQRYSRLSGLSDFEISSIRYSKENRMLMIAYQSSNIDLLYDDGTVVGMPDIMMKNIVGGKGINNIRMINITFMSGAF